MEGRVERIARENGTAADDFSGEGGFVEGGEEFERAAGVVARGERAASGVHIGDEGGELRGVGGADVGWETLPSLREGIGFFLRGGRFFFSWIGSGALTSPQSSSKTEEAHSDKLSPSSSQLFQ